MAFTIDTVNGSTNFSKPVTGATLAFTGTVPASLGMAPAPAVRVECRVLLGVGNNWIKTNCRITSGTTWQVTFPVLTPPLGVNLRVIAHLFNGTSLVSTVCQSFSFATS